MTQDNWQDFDRQVRSMLQDAEVKAPRRVWRAVSSRLDSAAAAAAWWKWAVPAFAAAAIAAGLFFTWGGKDTVHAPQNIIAQATDTPAAQAPEGVPGPDSGNTLLADASVGKDLPADARSGRDLSADARSGRVAGSKSGEGPVSGEDRVSGEAPVSGDGRVSDKAPVSGGTGADVPASGEAPVSSGSKADVPVSGEASGTVSGNQPGSGKEQGYSMEEAAKWASIVNDSSVRRSVRLSSLYAQGGVGGNDSNIKYGGAGISHMAPGPGSADAGISEAGSSTYGVPFTIGLGTRIHLSDKFSLGTGLEYSLLTRTFNGTYSDNYTGGIYHAVQYVGIPVNAYYDLMNTGDGLFNVYAWGGGAAEVCVSNSYRLMSAPGTTIKDKAGSMQFSVALGVGVEIPISGKLSLYLDPAVRYYFHGNQPKSLRTDKPFMFNFDAGLRFNL